MGFEHIPTTAAGQNFFDNLNLLKRIEKFQREVEANPAVYEPGVLRRFEEETIVYGTGQLQDMYRVLIARDFPTGSVPSTVGPLLESNLKRYQELWTRNVQNGFATAASSIPGRTKFGNRTILQRLVDFFTSDDNPEPTVRVPARVRNQQELFGIVRSARVSGKLRIFKQRLAPYLKMLFRTYPMNFLRDHNLVVSRWKNAGGEGEEVFYISAGKSHNSSPVCAMCQGRALTRSALRMATRELQSPLFHPNCRHRILSQSGGTEATYDGSRGPLVTVDVVRGWIGRNGIKRAKRPHPVTINV